MTVERKTPAAARASPISSGCWWPRCFEARFFLRTREGARGFSKRFLRRRGTAARHSTCSYGTPASAGAPETFRCLGPEALLVRSACVIRWILVSWAANAVVLGITGLVLSGMTFHHSVLALIEAAAVFGVLNTILKP